MKAALYPAVGSTLTHYEADIEAATLRKRAAVSLPSSIQYAWEHPSRQFLYVSSSIGAPGRSGNQHHLTAFRIDATTGALTPHGSSTPLRQRPVHNSVDIAGRFALVAYNDPSGVSVFHINQDGTIGAEVFQPKDLDFGIYAHQFRVTPFSQTAILVTRGNSATAKRPEDPGSIKVFEYKDGLLSNKGAVQPGQGFGFGPRHLDFHPTTPWVFVSVERQNQLYVYRLEPDGTLSRDPLFVISTVTDRSFKVSSAGPIRVHPNGSYVYVGNRGGWIGSAPSADRERFNGIPVFPNHHSNLAVFSIDHETGEPKLVQSIDSRGAHPRTFSLDQSGRMLVAGNLVPVALSNDGKVVILPACLAVFRIRGDGRLDYVRKYDVETGRESQWWTGMVALD